MTSDEESIVFVDKEGESWRVRAPGWGSFSVSDRALAGHIFNMVRFAHRKGREEAFGAVCRLIGAQQVVRRDYDV